MDSNHYNIKTKVLKAIEEFNQYRSPEAKAELVSLKKDLIEVNFSGYFCYTCGFYYYF